MQYAISKNLKVFNEPPIQNKQNMVHYTLKSHIRVDAMLGFLKTNSCDKLKSLLFQLFLYTWPYLEDANFPEKVVPNYLGFQKLTRKSMVCFLVPHLHNCQDTVESIFLCCLFSLDYPISKNRWYDTHTHSRRYRYILCSVLH